MATTPNYGFIMPDPTDFVTDLPADFEIFGDEVDARIKALNPETTQGDISFRGATANAKTRLGIGTAGQVLTVNSGATAPEWAALPTPPAPATTWSLMNSGNTTVPTNANTWTVSNLPARNKYMVIFSGVSVGAAYFLDLRINGTTGAAYNYDGYSFINPDQFAATNLERAFLSSGNSFFIGRANTNQGIGGMFMIDGCQTSTHKVVNWFTGATGYTSRIVQGAGWWSGSAVVSSMQFYNAVSGNNFNGGSIFIYGAN